MNLFLNTGGPCNNVLACGALFLFTLKHFLNNAIQENDIKLPISGR